MKVRKDTTSLRAAMSQVAGPGKLRCALHSLQAVPPTPPEEESEAHKGRVLREWSSKRLAIKGHSVIAFGSRTCNGVELLPNTRHQARLVINTVLAAFMWIAARSILIFWNTVF